MVAAFDFCAFGKGGAAPSIDTAMHGLVEAAHVDHLHPDAGIAFATAADGEALTAECFGDRVAWVPWRRPGFQLGLDIAAIRRDHPGAIGVILGGHGITAWGQTQRRVRGALAGDHRHRAEVHRRARGNHAPVRRNNSPATPRGRAARARRRPHAGDPRAGLHRPGSARALQRPPGGAGVPRRRQAPGAGRARHVVPGPLPAHQGAADGARPAAGRAARGGDRPPARAARGVPGGLQGLLRAVRDPGLAADARRGPGDRAGARGRHVQLRRGQADRAGGRRVLPERDQRHARRRGHLGVRADPGEREVPHRVLGARGGQAAAAAEAQAPGGADRAGHRRRVGHRPGDRRAAGRRRRVRRRGRPGQRVGVGRGRRYRVG